MAKRFKVGILNYRENLFDVFLKSFRSEGHEVELFQLSGSGWLDCLHFIENGKFDFFLIGNFSALHSWAFGQELETYLADHKKICAIWHWEKIFFSGSGYLLDRLKRGPLSKNFMFFVTDKDDVAILKAYDIHTIHLPLAVDDALLHFRPDQKAVKRLSHDLCFSGMPFFLQGIEKNDETALGNVFVVNNLLEFYSHLVTNKISPKPSSDVHLRIVNKFSEFYSGIYLNIDDFKSALEQLEAALQTDLDSRALDYLKKYRYRIAYIYSYFQLCTYLNRLKKFDIRVYGSPEWSKYLYNYSHEIPRLSDDEFYTLLHASKITFCLTKLQFRNFVHERSMMTLACGGFPITDYREAIHEIFEKDELICFHSIEEAEDLITYYLKHDEERKKISQKGQARVFNSHTYSHRVRTMIDEVQSHFGL
ncbi:MAG: CgeB family protein [Bacteriovoracaceae bacterium]|nr:CgeB family protein [Bacteriovoracaceae bacterium]